MTAAQWIETITAEAGIDTSLYKTHSVRAAASTAAVLKGKSIQDVKRQAHWSLRSNTFEQYYFRPNDQHIKGAEITETLFSHLMENKTTSEDGTQSTEIVSENSPHNRQVDEVESEDVVGAQP